MGGGDGYIAVSELPSASSPSALGDTAVGWGWELLIVAAGFGLIAYSSVDRQPGPAYIGVLNLWSSPA